MNDLHAAKAAARTAGFARRKAAYETARADQAAHLSGVLAGYRGVPLAGYMPIRTEIDPRPAMEEAAAYGPVGVPVITGEGQPLLFSRWEPDMPMVDGPFGAKIPEQGNYFEPEIVIVPLVAFDRAGGRLGYGGGFYDRTLEGLRERWTVMAIGFAFATQEASDLPLEATDQKLDFIVTEKGVIALD